jgi:disulfide oxidoreductase YuzD
MNKDSKLIAEAYTSIYEKKDPKVCAAKGGDCKCDKCDACKENCTEHEMNEALENLLESKHINKKFARRYTKVVGSMLKAEPGSDEYKKLKEEKEDLVKILADHGMTPTDLDQFLAKKVVAAEAPAPVQITDDGQVES